MVTTSEVGVVTFIVMVCDHLRTHKSISPFKIFVC